MKRFTTYLFSLRIFQFLYKPKVKETNDLSDIPLLFSNIRNKKAGFVAIDVETAQGPRWSICQIGLVYVENGVIKESKCYYVQPPGNKYMPPQIRVHGITPEITVDAPYFPEVWKEIWPSIENRLIVAHNTDFDINSLEKTLEFYQMEIPEFQYICTFQASGMSLADACEAYDIDLSNHHNAECDALACANIFIKLINKIEPTWTGRPAVKPKAKNLYDFTGHDKIQGDLLKPDLVNTDPDHPFYARKIVFTGILDNIVRNDAAMKVKSLGADIDTSIGKRTDYVIVGRDPGWKKMENIEKYNDEGSNIRIIYESEFLNMINQR